jgi:chemotaxis protein MotB
MNKLTILLASIVLGVAVTSCVTKKKFTELDDKNKGMQKELAQAYATLKTCDEEKTKALIRMHGLEEQIDFLKKNNQDLMNSVGSMTSLTQKGAENLEKSLESMKEKDTRITRLQDAITKKDSMTLALVTSLKSSLGDINDPDIEVNVEKGVVYISIADKLLFKSGSYVVQEKAKTILGKVATVVNSKPDIDIMVEGHTDNVPVIKSTDIADNWDLSVKRATSVVRILQNDYNVAPARLVAAGRSEYIPLVANTSDDGKAKNRRTRIVVLPKIDQFYKMIEEGMKQAPK